MSVVDTPLSYIFALLFYLLQASSVLSQSILLSSDSHVGCRFVHHSCLRWMETRTSAAAGVTNPSETFGAFRKPSQISAHARAWLSECTYRYSDICIYCIVGCVWSSAAVRSRRASVLDSVDLLTLLLPGSRILPGRSTGTGTACTVPPYRTTDTMYGTGTRSTVQSRLDREKSVEDSSLSLLVLRGGRRARAVWESADPPYRTHVPRGVRRRRV